MWTSSEPLSRKWRANNSSMENGPGADTRPIVLALDGFEIDGGLGEFAHHVVPAMHVLDCGFELADIVVELQALANDATVPKPVMP